MRHRCVKFRSRPNFPHTILHGQVIKLKHERNVIIKLLLLSVCLSVCTRLDTPKRSMKTINRYNIQQVVRREQNQLAF